MQDQNHNQERIILFVCLTLLAVALIVLIVEKPVAVTALWGHTMPYLV